VFLPPQITNVLPQDVARCGREEGWRTDAGTGGEGLDGGVWPPVLVARAPLMITPRGKALIFSTDSTP